MTKRGIRRLIAFATVVAVLAGGLAGAYFARQWYRDRQAAQARAAGLAAFKDQRHADAIAELAKALGRRADDPEALLAMARSLVAAAREDRANAAKAIPYAVRAASLTPTDPQPLALLLEIYAGMRRWTETLATADKLLALKPGDRAALDARLAALSALGNRDKTLDAAKALVAAFPDDTTAHFMLLMTMRQAGSPDSALLEHAKAAQASRPESQAFKLLLAQVAAGVEDHPLAVETAAGLADARPKDLDVFQGAFLLLSGLRSSSALSAEQSKRVASASEALIADALAHAADDPQRAAIIAPKLWLAGRSEETAKAVASAAANPDAPDALLGLAALSVADADPGVRDRALNTLRARSSAAAKSWVATAEAQELLSAKKPSDAADRCRQAVSDDPANAIAPFVLALAKSALGDVREAERAYRSLIAANPGATLARIRLAALLLDRGDLEGARDVALAALRSNARTGDAALQFAEACCQLAETGRDARSLPQITEMLHAMVAQHPDSGHAVALLARTLFAQGDSGQAEAVVRKAQDARVAIPPGQLLALLRAAQAARSPVADSILSQVDAAEPMPEVIGGRAAMLAEAGDLAAARALIAKSAAAAPQFKPAWQRLEAGLLDRAGAPEAIEKLKDLARDQPEDPGSLTLVLDARSSWGDRSLIQSTLASLQRVLGEASSVCRLYEARKLVAFDRDPAKASLIVRQLAQITDADPSNVLALALQGEAMLIGSASDIRTPLKLFARAVDAEPSNPRHYPRLLQLLQAVGDPGEAARRLAQFSALRNLPTELLQIRADAEFSFASIPDAIRDYRELVSRGVQSAKFGLAGALLRTGHRAEAMALAEELAAQPKAEAMVAASRLFALMGEPERALKLADSLPLDLPADAREQSRLEALIAVGRGDEALSLLKSRAERDKSAEAWLSLARFSLTRREIKAAQAAIDSGLRVDPQNAELKKLASATKLFAGEQLGRAGIEEVALTLVGQQDAPGMSDLLSAIQAYNAEPKNLSAFIEKASGITRDRPSLLPAWQSLIVAQVRAGRLDDAIGSARSASLIFPASPAIPRLAASQLMLAGQPADAIPFAREWRTRIPNGDAFDPDVLIADALLASGRAEEALQSILPYFDRIAGGDGGPSAIEVLGSALAAKGQFSRIQEVLWSRAGKNPDDAIAAVRVAGRSPADPAGMAQWLDRLDPLLPPSGNARFQLAEAWLQLGGASANRRYLERAKSAAEAAREDPLVRGQASFSAARALVALNRPTDAAPFFASAAKELPNRPDILLAYAQCLIESGAPAADALAAARLALSGAGTEPRLNLMAQVVLGRALLASGQADKAEESFRNALKANAADPQPLAGLLACLHAQGKEAELKQAISNAASPQTRLAALMQAAAGFDAKKLHFDAEKFYRLAVESSPGEPMALNNLAFMLFKSSGREAEGVEIAERALRAAEKAKLPVDALTAIADTLAVGYLKTLRFADAERICNQARQRDPKSFIPLLGLAEAASAQGDRAAADRFLAEIGPDVAFDAETSARISALRSPSK